MGVRFYDLIPGERRSVPSEIILKEGETYNARDQCRRTDDGWVAAGTSYVHEGDAIRAYYSCKGNDCDGRWETHITLEAALDKLAEVGGFLSKYWKEGYGNVVHRSRKIKVPEWRVVASEQRDEFAERMGY